MNSRFKLLHLRKTNLLPILAYLLIRVSLGFADETFKGATIQDGGKWLLLRRLVRLKSQASNTVSPKQNFIKSDFQISFDSKLRKKRESLDGGGERFPALFDHIDPFAHPPNDHDPNLNVDGQVGNSNQEGSTSTQELFSSMNFNITETDPSSDDSNLDPVGDDNVTAQEFFQLLSTLDNSSSPLSSAFKGRNISSGKFGLGMFLPELFWDENTQDPIPPWDPIFNSSEEGSNPFEDSSKPFPVTSNQAKKQNWTGDEYFKLPEDLSNAFQSTKDQTINSNYKNHFDLTNATDNKRADQDQDNLKALPDSSIFSPIEKPDNSPDIRSENETFDFMPISEGEYPTSRRFGGSGFDNQFGDGFKNEFYTTSLVEDESMKLQTTSNTVVNPTSFLATTERKEEPVFENPTGMTNASSATLAEENASTIDQDLLLAIVVPVSVMTIVLALALLWVFVFEPKWKKRRSVNIVKSIESGDSSHQGSVSGFTDNSTAPSRGNGTPVVAWAATNGEA